MRPPFALMLLVLRTLRAEGWHCEIRLTVRPHTAFGLCVAAALKDSCFLPLVFYFSYNCGSAKQIPSIG